MDTLTRQLIHSNMYEQVKRELRETKARNAKLNEENESLSVKNKKLAGILSTLIGTIEEVYEKDPELLHIDNAVDYEDAVKLLNESGFNYRAKSSILDLIR